MIAPSKEGGIGGALNTGALHVQSFFGDKMAEHALQKMAAQKALEKGGEELVKKGVEGVVEKGAGGMGAGSVVNMGLQAAGIDARHDEGKDRRGRCRVKPGNQGSRCCCCTSRQ